MGIYAVAIFEFVFFCEATRAVMYYLDTGIWPRYTPDASPQPQKGAPHHG